MQSQSKRIVLTPLILAAALLGVASAQNVNDKGQTFPAVNLPKFAKGAGIISALGARLPEVARWYGLTEIDFRVICQRDKDLRADRNGRLHYVCQGGVANAGTATNSGTVAAGAFPDSQTFFLHSKPGATRVIYLDFNGHTTTGTYWNDSATGSSFTTPAYDSSNNGPSFSSAELSNIQDIWQRVSEDFAPWDVDVTTEEPPLESLRKTSASDLAYGVRVVIGGTSEQVLGAGVLAGGVAYIGSFSWNSDTPCFVFEEQLANGYPKYIAEAASHEAGHTVGLNHDGTTTGVEYYQGHANWAPIMGVGYYKEVTQWSKGEYASANNTEDDTAIINGHIPRRADDAGDLITSAAPLSSFTPSASGIIESRTDNDLFSFFTGAGAISFTAGVAAPSPNLDVKLSLYDGSGNLLTSSDITGLPGSLSANVAAGTYYVGVDGVGVGSGSTGYTDYGSLGQYWLSGTLQSTGNQPPVAVASQSSPTSGTAPLTVNFSSVGSNDPEGSALTYDWDFGDGASSTSANPSYTYTTPGSYTASLVVFDAGGLASTPASVLINVAAASVPVYVADIVMTLTSNSQGYQATAKVTVKNSAGLVVPGAVVTGNWSNLTTGTGTATTSSTGVATFTSKRSRKRGTFTFGVSNVTISGGTYTPSMNVKTSASIATP